MCVPDGACNAHGADVMCVPDGAFNAHGEDVMCVPDGACNTHGADVMCIPDGACNTHGADVMCVPNKILILITQARKRQSYYDSTAGSITKILIYVNSILIFNLESF
jgi:hypothetical protein